MGKAIARLGTRVPAVPKGKPADAPTTQEPRVRHEQGSIAQTDTSSQRRRALVVVILGLVFVLVIVVVLV
jgi:hypothetical protein